MNMSYHHVHPLWYKLYSAATNVAWLTAFTIRYAVELTEAIQDARAVAEAEGQQEVLRFQEVGGDHDGPETASSDDNSVASDASFSAHLSSAACRVFETPSLRPKQHTAVTWLVMDPSSGGKLLVCERTGGGESIMLYLSAVCVAGITVVIIPLLSLTANQLSRIRKAIQKYGIVIAYNLDAASRADIKNKIIPKLDNYSYSSSISMLLSCSPQSIADNTQFMNPLLRAQDREVLRLIVIDEAHLYAMHGRSLATLDSR